MTATQNASDSGATRLGAFHRHPTEVVVGLVNDGSALPVAAVTVREAVRRRLPVRFLQLVARVSGTGHDSSAEAARPLSDAQHFRARHRGPRHPGRGSQPWRRRLGRRQPRQRRTGPSLADYCRAHADCAVHAVDLDD